MVSIGNVGVCQGKNNPLKVLTKVLFRNEELAVFSFGLKSYYKLKVS